MDPYLASADPVYNNLPPEEVATCTDLFRLMDVEGAGTISSQQLRELFQKIHVHMPEEDLDLLLTEMDYNENGPIIRLEDVLRLIDVQSMDTGATRTELMNAYKLLLPEGLDYDESRKKSHISAIFAAHLPEIFRTVEEAKFLLDQVSEHTEPFIDMIEVLNNTTSSSARKNKTKKTIAIRPLPTRFHLQDRDREREKEKQKQQNKTKPTGDSGASVDEHEMSHGLKQLKIEVQNSHRPSSASSSSSSSANLTISLSPLQNLQVSPHPTLHPTTTTNSINTSLHPTSSNSLSTSSLGSHLSTHPLLPGSPGSARRLSVRLEMMKREQERQAKLAAQAEKET